MRWLLAGLIVVSFGACTSEVIHNPQQAQQCREDGGSIKSNSDDPENTALCETNQLLKWWNTLVDWGIVIFLVVGGLMFIYFLFRERNG